MDAESFEMEEAAQPIIEEAVISRLRELEALATESRNAEFYFEIMALRQRLGLPLEDKK